MLDPLRSRRPGPRVAVRLVVAVALVSITTGVGSIVTEPMLAWDGALEPVRLFAEFSATIVGFALLVAAWGMRRGYRIASIAATVLVVLAAVHGLAHSRVLSIPLVVLSLVALVVLVLTVRRFHRPAPFDATQLGATLAIVGVLAYGTAGAYELRDGFDGVSTGFDALYFAFVTASTVGYGDVHATTASARLFAVSLVVLGPTAVAVVVSSLVGPALETRLGRTERESADRSDGDDAERIVVLGCDAATFPMLATLIGHASVLVVTDDEDTAAWLESRGVETRRGDPTDATALEELERADAAVVAMDDPGRVGATVLAVRTADADVFLLALAPDGNVAALEGAGVDVAVDPWRVVADAVADATLERR
ncbi:ion channel [Natrialbaceae archaeon AArc-T1-2]|uniref:ion channel n=1 Tax=Natrialbaceae archaeon AArc-T1-2 TaxID=3053904 RepID=UPI00255B2A35|nr:ion channel [Natrialbaceae archaeon AArc-T1-2]WIV67459.1 ion channel [Natrialbaceae archaeon AArc-T1-2]